MWLYIIGGVILVAVLFVLYLMYKGYSKVKPKPLPGKFLARSFLLNEYLNSLL